MGMILRIASSRIVGQGDIVGRSGYFSLNLSANSVMRGRLDARRTLKSLVADLRLNTLSMEKLTIQEEEAMLYIWELGSCFVKDIVAKYPKPAPPYTTVASIVKNLERKQYIRAARVGNTYQYTPLIRESEYKRTFMSGFVRNYYNPQIEMFARFKMKSSFHKTKRII